MRSENGGGQDFRLPVHSNSAGRRLVKLTVGKEADEARTPVVVGVGFQRVSDGFLWRQQTEPAQHNGQQPGRDRADAEPLL